MPGATARDEGVKAYWRGTERIVSPAETIEKSRGHARALGITRIANVTGLDYLGIPVFMAVRPNGRSLSVSQGKGIEASSAKASALMEAIEFAHAEQIHVPLTLASFRELRARAAVVEPLHLPQIRNSRFRRDRKIAWISGSDLFATGDILVPYELVHLDCTLPDRMEAGCFLRGSNGLASGNHIAEAICAGLCEVIERDASSLWSFRDSVDRASRRLDLSTVADPECEALLGALSDHCMSVAVWDATTDIGVPVFICRIREMPRNSRSRLGAFWGAGCHTSRRVALARALTEAAQTRLTYIVGSRDDLRRVDYDEPRSQALMDLARDRWESQGVLRNFAAVPSWSTTTIQADLEIIKRRLRRSGLSQAIIVDLTRPHIGIPVIRAIVPGLEGPHDASGYVPGRRVGALRQNESCVP